jgi:hypothetical protein
MARGVNNPEVAAKLTSSKSESGLFGKCFIHGKCFIQASHGTVIELANVIKTIIPKIQNNIMEKV